MDADIRDAARARWRARGTRELVIASVALVLAYAVLHLLLLERFPWFVDETYFATYAQTAQGDPSQRFVALVDHKGLLPSWIGAFLIHFDVPPITAVRLLAIVPGAVGAAATGYLVWRWQRSRPTAIVTAALVAFIPYMLVNDSVGQYDSLVAAGSMVAIALGLELARHQRLDLTLVLGVVFGALLLTKPTGQLALALSPLSLVVFDWRRERRWRRLATWCGCLGLALVIALAMFGITRLSPLAYTPEPKNHRSLSDLFRDPFANWGTVAPWAWRALWGYLTPPGVILAVWGLVRVMITRDRLGVVAVVWSGAGIVAFLLLTDSAFPRYGIQAIPPICILIAFGGFDLWTRARARVKASWLALAVGLLCVPALILDGLVVYEPQTAPYPGLDRAQYVTLASNREPVREAGEIILRRAPRSFTASTPPSLRTIAELGGWPFGILLAVNGTHWTPTPRFLLVTELSDHAQVNAARFVIVDGDAPGWLKIGGATRVKRWTRAGGGPSVVLYDRGAPTAAA